MGAANIIEKHIKDRCDNIWESQVFDKVPDLNVQIDSYRPSFVHLAVIVGAITLTKSTISLGKYILSKQKPKLKTKQQLQYRYGRNSWALVCLGQKNTNENYCKYLAMNGFNLILVGLQNKIDIIKGIMKLENNKIDVIQYIVNWQQSHQDLSMYQNLQNFIKQYDISIIVLPKIDFQNQQISNLSGRIKIPAIEVNPMIVRYFAPRLAWRQCYSAIIFPSSSEAAQPIIVQGKGIINASIAFNDSLGQIINFQLSENKLVEIIVARGSPQNAFALLGIKPISQ